jgi:hypothetical protein
VTDIAFWLAVGGRGKATDVRSLQRRDDRKGHLGVDVIEDLRHAAERRSTSLLRGSVVPSSATASGRGDDIGSGTVDITAMAIINIRMRREWRAAFYSARDYDDCTSIELLETSNRQGRSDDEGRWRRQVDVCDHVVGSGQYWELPQFQRSVGPFDVIVGRWW